MPTLVLVRQCFFGERLTSKISESLEKCGNFWLLAAAVVPWNAWKHLASLVLHLHFMSRNSYLYVLCALPRWLLSSTFPSLAGLGGRQSMIYWHILAMIGYGWRLTQHTSISNQGNSPHVCSCPFFLSFPIISDSNLPHTHIQTSWLVVKLHAFLRSHSKVGLVKHREVSSPETLRDSRLWNNGRESWQLVTNVFQGWANPNPFLTILEYCIKLQY